VLPGGELPVTIYYRVRPDTRNLSLSLTALDREGRPIGKIDTYPGGGSMTTAALGAGTLYADTYRLPLDRAARGPMQVKIELGWWNYETKERIKPVQADGTPLDALILRGGTLLSADPPPQPDSAQPATFSGALRLQGFSLSPADGLVRPGDSLQVTLIWEGLTPVYEDFTVFVHLETDDGQLIGQDDAPPLRGDYPTSAWAVGQPLADPHTVKIKTDTPPGTYRLTVGLYRARDLSRLPVDTGGDMLILKTPITVK
jgi:hypothetical protein